MALEAKKLEAKNRELDAFAGRVAHDVRGALTTITWALMPLSATPRPADGAVESLRRAIARMAALVEDLLALALADARVRGRCDPAAVLARLERDFAPRLEVEGGALRVAVAHAEVPCSEGLLMRAVSNLIDNAVKYHRPAVSPVVKISGAPIDGGYDLSVSDNGVGMSAEDAERVFEPFYRSPRARHLPGTGLGLSMVNRVAVASGGKLSVRTRLGEGTTFVVHLPLLDGARDSA